MRRLLLTALIVGVHQATLTFGQEPETPPDQRELSKQRADATIKLGQQHAADFAIHRSDQRDAEFKLHPAAVLRFTNPVPQETGGQAQEVYGGVFLWLNQGRPEAVVAVLKVYSPGTPFVLHELASLSEHRIVAQRQGTRQWFPDRAGIKRMPLQDAPGPAATPLGRLAQMRAMARQFAANKTDRDNRTTELRLLSKPLYRYQSSDPADIIDGALFAFVDGTDPEVLLLVEAHRKDGANRWYFAPARLNLLHIKLRRQAQTVWEVPALTRQQWRNRQAPYTLLRQPAAQAQ